MTPFPCRFCKRVAVITRSPTTSHCRCCGALYEFPTRIDNGTMTVPTQAKTIIEIRAAIISLLPYVRTDNDFNIDDYERYNQALLNIKRLLK